jgi:hypothetical protein
VSSDVEIAAAQTKVALIDLESERVFKKAALFGLLFLVGTGLGLYAGWELSSSFESAREWRSLDSPDGHDFFNTYDLIARLRLADMGAAMRLQNPKENPERRREYLNLILDAVQKGRAGVTDPTALTLIDVETGITYARLAMVEGAAGNVSASQTWMRKAQIILKQAGWKDCSDSHLKEIVQMRNKQDSCDSPCDKS